MSEQTNGALIGWRRIRIRGGTAVRLQIAASAERLAAREFEIVTLSLNDRRLAAFIRDLSRSAAHRGISRRSLKPREG